MEPVDAAAQRLARLSNQIVDDLKRRMSLMKIVATINELSGDDSGVATMTRMYNTLNGTKTPLNGGHIMRLCEIAKAPKHLREQVAAAWMERFLLAQTDVTLSVAHGLDHLGPAGSSGRESFLVTAFRGAARANGWPVP